MVDACLEIVGSLNEQTVAVNEQIAAADVR
jgi:hypothetical protein